MAVSSLLLHKRILLRAQEHSDASAVICGERSLTFAELDRASAGLAARLMELGVCPGDFVGVLLHRSVELAVSILAILRCGAAYVPLDPDYPAERLRFMLEDCGATVLLTRDDGASDFVASHVRKIDPAADSSSVPTEAFAEVSADSPAYMIYTSGSTGQPKGVVISHRAILHSLDWLTGSFDALPGEGVLQKAPISFDFSVWELFFPLVSGLRLVLAKPGGQHDPLYLADLIRNEKIAWAFFVPSMLSRFLESVGDFTDSPLKHVFCSGEALPADVVRRFFLQSHARLHNVYGPTEAAVEVTHFECPRDTVPADPTPIGKVFPGLHLTLLDDQLHPAAEDETGEICIGGPQLALGYHQRPELTSASFITGPDGSRLYRTGDNGRRLPDGTWLCLGRRDHQIKLRGFRVELGEIETALQSHPFVRQAIAGVRTPKGGEPTLHAWLIAEGTEAPTISALREHLLRDLPDHMIPARFVWMEKFPLNPSGKIDRPALPDAGRERPLSTATFQAANTETQKRLAQIWMDLLQLDSVGIDDPFFEIGGDSLSIVRVHAALEKSGVSGLDVAELFEFVTIRSLSARLDHISQPAKASTEDRARLQREAQARRRGVASNRS